MDENLKKEIIDFAREMRITELNMFAEFGSGHIGGLHGGVGRLCGRV